MDKALKVILILSCVFLLNFAGSVFAETVPPQDHHPKGRSVGIGAGYIFGLPLLVSGVGDEEESALVVFPSPNLLLSPNTVSVRFRFDGGLTLEPMVSFFYIDRDSDEAKHLLFHLGSKLRYPLATRGNIDFDFLAGINLIYINDIPDDDANPSSSTLGVDVPWGLGLEYFFKPNWSLSFDALNPFVSFDQKSEEGGDSTKSLLIGVAFEPMVQLMFHLYF